MSLKLPLDIQDLEKTKKEMLEGLCRSNPLALLLLSDPTEVAYINSLLPYSTGFEIECNKKLTYDIVNFKRIPTLLDIDIDSSEQRYRIMNGINGFICLYLICNQLKLNSTLNLGSGIHYHIDCRDLFERNSIDNILDLISWSNKNGLYNIILSELDKWEYKGKYNARNISTGTTWIRLSHWKTFEFRLGEMSFDYEILAKRIIHANQLTRLVKDEAKMPMITYPTFQKDAFLNYLKLIGANITKYSITLKTNPKNIINNRIVKL